MTMMGLSFVAKILLTHKILFRIFPVRKNNV